MNSLFEAVKGKPTLVIDIYGVLFTDLLHEKEERFLYIEQCCQISGYAEARADAEQYSDRKMNHSGSRAPGLDRIYEKMHRSYSPAKDLEESLSLLSMRVDPAARELMNRAVKDGVSVYLSNNSYLGRESLTAALEENGCTGYRSLYCPETEEDVRGMYRDIMAETGASAADMLHIAGDADNGTDKETGVARIVYESLFRRCGQNKNSAYFATLNAHKGADMMIPLLEGSIALRGATHGENDGWNAFGYKYIGPLALEYAKYIRTITKSLHLKKLFFSSKNGRCLKDVCGIVMPEIETEMIAYSRRSFTLSCISNGQNITDELMQSIKAGATFKTWFTWLFGKQTGSLGESYAAAFPEQDYVISAEEDYARLRVFIENNRGTILEMAAEEKAALQSYLETKGVFSEYAAVVDTGETMDLLEGLKKAFGKLQSFRDLTAFWWEYTPSVSWKFGPISHFKTKKRQKATLYEDECYLSQVLTVTMSESQNEEACFAAGILPSANTIGEDSIWGRVYSGAMDCVRELLRFDEAFPTQLRQDCAAAVCEYLQEHIDRKDQALVESAFNTDNVCGGYVRPVFRQGHPVIGIANPWPQDVSAEEEVITRIKRTAGENRIECILIDGFGHILNDKQGITKQYVDAADLSFIITTHYECAKVQDVFYYNPLWNPPEIPLNLSDYATRVTNQFIMNDDFLIYDDGGMSNHLRSVLMNCPRTLEGASALTASFPASAALAPKLDKPIMFYCGMNWEVMFGGPGRHDGLFKLLDDTNKVKFYGPERVEAWGGLEPWKGYRCYQGMIPFDGFSILERINECGICLVLSSDTHRRAGAATNRLYEACAAGAVIISDDNEFVLRHFKDAALFINFNKNDPIDTFRQIMEKYEWIVKHPEKALALARRAQEIYLKEYSLDVQLERIITNHPARFRQLGLDLFAKDEEGKVLVTFVLNTQDIDEAKDRVDVLTRNLHDQLYRNIECAVAADESIAAAVTNYCSTRCACVNVIPMALFDKKGSRALTDGEAVRKLQQAVPHDYYINTTAEETWFFDHITSLVRAVTENDSIGAYSGCAFEDGEGQRRVNFFDKLDLAYLFYDHIPNHPLSAGQFLFRSDSHALMPEYLFGSVDGKEHILYAGFLRYRAGKKLAFTKRMSLSYSQREPDERASVLSDVMQYRFIRDILRFYLPEQPPATPLFSRGGVEKMGIGDLVLYMPLRAYFLLRYYRFRMRGKNPESPSFKKYAAKYDACLEKYREFWNG